MRKPKTFNQIFLKASRAAGMGSLMDATRLIQRTLLNPIASADFSPLFGATPVKARRPAANPSKPGAAAFADVEDVMVVDEPVSETPAPVTPRPPPGGIGLNELLGLMAARIEPSPSEQHAYDSAKWGGC